MLKYAQRWKWSKEKIKDFDNFDNWDYTKIMVFWNSVKKFMLLSYQKITNELPNLNLQQRISETDYTLLSHKIKANFIPDENAIDIYVTFKDVPYEAILYIEPVNLGIKNTEWRVYKRNIASPGQVTTLKTKNDIVKLSAWIALNHIFDPVFSRVQVQSGYTKIDQSVIQNLLTDILNLFGKNKIPSKNDFFLRPSFTVKTMLILNFNDKDSDYINSIYYLYKNSWEQTYIYHYDDPKALTEIIKTILADALKLKLPYNECCAINVPNSFKKNYKLIDRFFREAYAAIVIDHTETSVRFVGALENDLFCITKEKTNVSVLKIPNILALLSYMSVSPRTKIKYSFLADEPRLAFLKEIMKKWRRNMVSIVYENKDPFTFIYVLNEGGNIFNFIVKKEQMETAIANLCQFLIDVIQNVNRDSLILNLRNELELIRLSKSEDGKFIFSNDTALLKSAYEKKDDLGKAFSATITKNGGNSLYSLETPTGVKTASALINSLPNIMQTLPETNTFPFVAKIKFSNLQKNDLLLGTGTYLAEKARLDILLSKHTQNSK